MRRLEFHSHQIPAVRAFLAQLQPKDELTYRLALAGMLPHFRGTEWTRRRDELMAKLAPDEAAAERYYRRSRAMEERLRFILAGLG